jgi:hypothetical protein
MTGDAKREIERKKRRRKILFYFFFLFVLASLKTNALA